VRQALRIAAVVVGVSAGFVGVAAGIGTSLNLGHGLVAWGVKLDDRIESIGRIVARMEVELRVLGERVATIEGYERAERHLELPLRPMSAEEAPATRGM
jgi:hypothetical protein